MLLTWRKNINTFNAVFFYLFDLTFGHCQLLPLGKGEEEHENYFFSIKNGITTKNIFWANMIPKMMSSLNSGYYISIQAYYLCRFVTLSQGYQQYFGRLFYIYEKPWKNVISFWSDLHGLESIFIDSSILSRDYNSSLWYS